ncbi:uncharacterized protein M6B38_118820 [Iris pallida]|uniref:RNA-binding S4 domain-containing protein n=1 Tax=Iris pallida TaxID=29817 RepID=A0AAX6HIH0_IRIPA|nr:uncharacterized protein M6B38_118820 [Iris pallida]
MAAMAMAASASLLSPFPSPSLRRRLPSLLLLRASSTEFNITFAPSPAKTPKPQILVPDPNPNPSSPPVPLVIPWIVRGEDGSFRLQSTPPVRLLHALSDTKPASPAKSKNKTRKDPKPAFASSSAPPPFSKAARRFYNQKIREPQRLSKVLAAAGVASRRSSEELIFGGKVTVNGSVCTTPQTRVDLLKDSIYVNGNRLSKKLPPKLYFALNKPKGYICSSGEESKSIISLFDGFWDSWNKLNPGVPKPRLFTVGRLDVGTTGLIVVTNDGDFAQSLAHPSSNLSKEYIATIDGSVHRRHLIAISEGTKIDGVHCVPDSVELLPAQPEAPRSRLRIVVHEGRNHEVRELVKNAGLKIYSLKRVRIGGFRLPSDLGLGKYVELKQAELKALGGAIQRSTKV